MQITEHLFQSFVGCPYKAHLLLKGTVGQRSDYEILQDELCSAYLSGTLRTDYEQLSYQLSTVKSRGSSSGRTLITTVQVAYGELSSFCEIVVKNNGNSSLGQFYYSPVVITHKNKISKEDKALLAFRGLILERMQNRSPEYGLIIYGNSRKITRVKIAKLVVEVRRAIEKVNTSIEDLPQMIINQHCQICEYHNY